MRRTLGQGHSELMNVIGMISGTSFDAIEAAALEITLDANTVHARLLGHSSVPYAPELHDAVAAMLPPATTTVDEVCRLDTLIGQSFANVAATLSERHFPQGADVICSHGQTVFHWVKDGHALGTLQLGQAAWIGETTGATVVTDVRSRDVAAGGHGAPLASLVDVLLLGKNPPKVRGALNLGGISNITVVGPVDAPIAFDIGPANALMDAAVTWLSDGAETYDHEGQRAARGDVDNDLLNDLLTDPYYGAPAPKSTGKEYFHLHYLRARLGSVSIKPDDLLATLTALTAVTVAKAVRQYGVEEIFASGGGTRNRVLMAELRRRLPDVRIALVDEFGVPEAAKEAALFALIGFLTVHGLTSSVASCTGARHSSVLGAIIPGRQPVVQLALESEPTKLIFEDASDRSSAVS
jgi:anhydro-N-acetylmuramic acid kinase